ncbi:cell division protein FtsZ [Candidatus Puniceispirillum sp.]|nr:cell division protein FtsZ [Candidatus Puniceispirillum sp.]
MTINLTVPQNMQELRPRITVVGVGGAGCNAVNNMINANLEGVDFLVANTDGQALAHSLSSRKIQLGSAITQGLGAGSKPEIGRAAAEESMEDLMVELADCNMVFITAGMGGGTGTGAAPVIARAARERGILTVGVITKPFEFEGQRRMKQAEDGIEELQSYVDTLIVIPNQNLFRLANERTTFADAFHMADAVLHQGVCGVTDLMIKPGQINLDFADIRAVMAEMGKAMMGTGEASGETRATQAAEAAINNPLLDDTTMKGANAVLINITGGLDMTLFEVDEAANRIRKEVDPDATIIFGSAFDDKLDGVMRVSVVATGISSSTQFNNRPKAATTKSNFISASQEKIEVEPVTSFLDKKDVVSVGEEIVNTFNSKDINEPTPNLEEKTHDLVSQISNELANEAIANLAETPDNNKTQMKITATIDTTIKNTEIEFNQNMPKKIGDPFTETKSVTNEMEENEGLLTSLTNNKEERGQLKAGFIPRVATNMPDDETVIKSFETTVKHPSGLMNRISGLWSSKPANKPPVSIDESSTDFSPNEKETKEQIAASILDLGRSDFIKSETNVPKEPNINAHDEELDIPAFLRRQAN